jgi:prepilin-type N-terminal cleavage/methylation domain-containing protein
MLRKRGAQKGGFTLPEVLVTVAIVSVLAAIVVPTVTSQLSKGDDTSVQTNMSNLRTAVTAFVSDVRKFPGNIEHLLSAPVAADSALQAATSYGAAAVGRWRGPYMTGSLVAGALRTRTDSVNWGLAFAIDSLSDTAFVGTDGYVGVTLGGVANTAAALHIDSLIDGGTGQTAGNLRWAGAAPVVTDQRLILLLMGSR